MIDSMSASMPHHSQLAPDSVSDQLSARSLEDEQLVPFVVPSGLLLREQAD